jgi:formylglycine-generating enzyme required for sulfatase activity
MPSAQDLPESLGQLAYQNAISIRNDPDFNNDMERLIRDIKRIGDEIIVQYFEPETIHILEGTFWMGSPEGAGVPSYETPRHEVDLPSYRIGKYPVTNAQYEEFIRQTNRLVAPSMGWDGQRVPVGFEQHPVSGVTWYDALAYCRWLSEKTGRNYSLPNEAQWEKACRGENNCAFPWGDEFDPGRCNHGRPALAPVNAYPAQNEHGCFDLVGNVSQWTCTLWGERRIAPDPEFAYPWMDDGRNDTNGNLHLRRVVRGSSFKDNPKFLRCSARSGQIPEDGGFLGARYGFRIAMIVS